MVTNGEKVIPDPMGELHVKVQMLLRGVSPVALRSWASQWAAWPRPPSPTSHRSPQTAPTGASSRGEGTKEVQAPQLCLCYRKTLF